MAHKFGLAELEKLSEDIASVIGDKEQAVTWVRIALTAKHGGLRGPLGPPTSGRRWSFNKWMRLADTAEALGFTVYREGRATYIGPKPQAGRS